MNLSMLKRMADEIEATFTTTPKLGDVELVVPESVYLRLAYEFSHWPTRSGVPDTRAGLGKRAKGYHTVLVINEFLVVRPKVEDGSHS